MVLLGWLDMIVTAACPLLAISRRSSTSLNSSRPRSLPHSQHLQLSVNNDSQIGPYTYNKLNEGERERLGIAEREGEEERKRGKERTRKIGKPTREGMRTFYSDTCRHTIFPTRSDRQAGTWVAYGRPFLVAFCTALSFHSGT